MIESAQSPDEPALESTRARREQFSVLHHLHRRFTADLSGLEPATKQRSRRVAVDAAGGGHTRGNLVGVEEGASGPMAAPAQGRVGAPWCGASRRGGPGLHGGVRVVVRNL